MAGMGTNEDSLWHLLPSSRLLAKLLDLGVTSGSQLLAMNQRQLLALPGVGPGTVAKIEETLASRGRSLAVDPYAPYVCARHSEAARDAELHAYWLCDACRAKYEAESFSNRPPEWISGEVVESYCAHCNVKKAVRLTQWFLCGTCDRVVRSIGRSIASAKFVETEWSRVMSDSDLDVLETDAVELRPRGKRSDPHRVATADFHVMRHGTALFGFELKSGRSSLPNGGIGSPMAQFQLDTTDCDDIVAAAAGLQAPVILLHAQVIGRAEAPTERYEGVGLWWCRPWDMLPNMTGVQRRPRETRDAAYYAKDMFKPFDLFREYVDQSLQGDLERFSREGMPPLYMRI